MTAAVIPAFNEEKNISEVIKRTKKFVDKIIVVNDGSEDATEKKAKMSGAIVLTHKINLGLGASLKTGCDAAIFLGAKTIITLDADGQHDPEEIPYFLKKIDEGFDIVFGARTKNQKKMPLQKRIGNALVSNLHSLLFNINLSDIETGYRAFKSSAYKKIRWKSSGYGVANEIVVNTKKKNLSYCEIPVDTIYRDKYKGVNIREGISILLDLLVKRIEI